LLFAGHIHADELTPGAMLSYSCAGCHGTDGKSPGSIPTIAGKPAAFIESALRDYRADRRGGTVMNRHARAYSDEEIRLIAEFFASRE
jgi:sulfide dehydrogenase cytochrome subunit